MTLRRWNPGIDGNGRKVSEESQERKLGKITARCYDRERGLRGDLIDNFSDSRFREGNLVNLHDLEISLGFHLLSLQNLRKSEVRGLLSLKQNLFPSFMESKEDMIFWEWGSIGKLRFFTIRWWRFYA